MSETIEIKIDGMHCDGCVRRVTALLKKVEGAEIEEVIVGAARVKIGPGGPTRDDLAKAVAAGGFSAQA